MKEKSEVCIFGYDDVETVNLMIKVPEKLTSSDGRDFDIVSWYPLISDKETVKIECCLRPLKKPHLLEK